MTTTNPESNVAGIWRDRSVHPEKDGCYHYENLDECHIGTMHFENGEWVGVHPSQRFMWLDESPEAIAEARQTSHLMKELTNLEAANRDLSALSTNQIKRTQELTVELTAVREAMKEQSESIDYYRLLTSAHNGQFRDWFYRAKSDPSNHIDESDYELCGMGFDAGVFSQKGKVEELTAENESLRIRLATPAGDAYRQIEMLASLTAELATAKKALGMICHYLMQDPGETLEEAAKRVFNDASQAKKELASLKRQAEIMQETASQTQALLLMRDRQNAELTADLAATKAQRDLLLQAAKDARYLLNAYARKYDREGEVIHPFLDHAIENGGANGKG